MSLITSYLSKDISYLIFYVTNMCNFRCKFCYYSEEIQKGKKVDLLTLDQIKKISKNFKNLIQISFAGGEPFLRKDFNEITKIFIQNTGVRFINIPTNASLLDRMIGYLEDILPYNKNISYRLTFSIDGIKEQHDENRSMPGSFKKIEEAYKLISPLRKIYKNLSLDSNTVFTSKTENNIVEILTYLSKNFQFDNQTLTYARGSFPDESLRSFSEQKYKSALEYLKKRKKTKENRFLYPIYRAIREIAFENLIQIVFHDKFINQCTAVKKLIVVSEVGDVYPCELLTKQYPLGNLKKFDYNINNILKNTTSKNAKQFIKDTKCKCSFECALSSNVAWDYKMYPKILAKTLKNF